MMFKSPTAVTRPNFTHQILQLHEVDTCADRVAVQTWPLPRSRPVAVLQPNAKRPYLLTKSLKPTRRLPSPPFGLAEVATMPPLSGFVYSSTSFFKYAKPKVQFPLEQARGSDVPQDVSKHKQPSIVPEMLMHKSMEAPATKTAQQPRMNKFKRLSRNSPPQPHTGVFESQRNTVAFPTSSPNSMEDPIEAPTGMRKRSRAGPGSSSRKVDCNAQDKSLSSLFCNAVVPLRQKKSRRQRLFGRKFPARSFIPSLESIDEEIENSPSFDGFNYTRR